MSRPYGLFLPWLSACPSPHIQSHVRNHCSHPILEYTKLYLGGLFVRSHVFFLRCRFVFRLPALSALTWSVVTARNVNYNGGRLNRYHGHVFCFRLAAHGKVASTGQRIQSPAHASRTHAVHATVQPPPSPSSCGRACHYEPGGGRCRSVTPGRSAARRAAAQEPGTVHGSVSQVSEFKS